MTDKFDSRTTFQAASDLYTQALNVKGETTRAELHAMLDAAIDEAVEWFAKSERQRAIETRRNDLTRQRRDANYRPEYAALIDAELAALEQAEA